MTRLALGIDLDALDLYAGIHGLDAPLDERTRRLVPEVAAERFGDLCATLGIVGTLFVVGRDVAHGHGVTTLRRLAAAGHELASHSFAHDYALSRLDAAAIDDDLARAEAALAAITGSKPAGFRAPGYTLSDRLLETLARRGYLYDSSLLPSPAYYGAKAAVMGLMALRGRASHSILGSPGQLLRPRRPHIGPHGVRELPITTLPGVRVPWIGTLISLLPEAAGTLLSLPLSKEPLLVIELHGIDLLDRSDGLPEALAHRQRELLVPVATRWRRLESTLRTLLAGTEACTHADAARLCL